MTALWDCPHCHEPVSTAAELLARALRCPHCSGIFTTPAQACLADGALELAAAHQKQVAPPVKSPPISYIPERRRRRLAYTAGRLCALVGVTLWAVVLLVLRAIALVALLCMLIVKTLWAAAQYMVAHPSTRRAAHWLASSLAAICYWCLFGLLMVLSVPWRLLRLAVRRCRRRRPGAAVCKPTGKELYASAA